MAIYVFVKCLAKQHEVHYFRAIQRLHENAKQFSEAQPVSNVINSVMNYVELIKSRAQFLGYIKDIRHQFIFKPMMLIRFTHSQSYSLANMLVEFSWLNPQIPVNTGNAAQVSSSQSAHKEKSSGAHKIN